MDNIPDAVFRYTPDKNCNIEYISHYIEELTGYSANSFMNGEHCLINIVHSQYLLLVQNTVGSTSMPEHSYHIEYHIIHCDGIIRWIYERGVIINDVILNNSYLMGVMFDVTDRKLKGKDVRRLSMALHNTVEGVIFIDPNLNYTSVNQAYATMIGYCEDKLIGKCWLNNIHVSNQQMMRLRLL